MNKALDTGSLCLSCDPLGGLDVDGMERLRSLLDIKANCIHRAVGIRKRFGN